MFNHGNVRIPRAADRRFRWLLVTPEMHRVHHSVVRAETNSNFGFNRSCCDRALGNYRAEPERGQRGMTIASNSSATRLHPMDPPERRHRMEHHMLQVDREIESITDNRRISARGE